MKIELKNTRTQELKKLQRRESRSARWAHGFTMIEATIAMVIIAIAAAGILMPFGVTAAVQQEASLQITATNLATELMEKVLLTDPADLVATYGSYTEAKGAMIDTAGSVYTDSRFSEFSRSASCVAAMTASVDMVLIAVTVYDDGREITTLTTMVKE